MRAIKKIVALTTGTLMVGATILGAMAADLADYPKPLFIDDGKFDGAIVVGDKAAAEDVVGAIDIATSLQYSSTTVTTGVGAGTAVTAVGEAHKIEKTTNRLNLGEDVTDVQTAKIDADDLPTVLMDGVFRSDEGKDYDYEQEITLAPALFTAQSDNDYNDDIPFEGLRYDDGDWVLSYELEFTTAAESDIDPLTGELEDFEDTKITIMGKTYDIVDTDNKTEAYLELMGGALLDTLEEGETKVYSLAGREYEVTAIIVSDTAEQVKLKVNGEVTDALSEDDTWKAADGTQLGIRSILPNEAGEVTGGDVVEFYIGAEKVTLDHLQELEMGDDEIDDIIVTIDSTVIGDEIELSSIGFNWTTEDELFIADGDEAVMPGLESVKLSFEGMTVPGEERIKVEADGDDQIALRIPLEGAEDGYDIDLLWDNESIVGSFDRIGSEDYALLTTAGLTYTFDKDTDEAFVVTNTDSYESHLVKVTGFDADEGVDFEDVITGDTDKKIDYNETFDVADITFKVTDFNKTEKWVTITTTSADFAGDRLYSPLGMLVYLPTAVPGGPYQIAFEEEGDDDDVDGAQFYVEVDGDTFNNIDVEVSDTNLTEIGEMEENEFLHYELTGEVNTKAILDEGPDQAYITIFYPGGETYGNLYLAAAETTFGTAEVVSGGLAVERISVGTAQLASEITNVAAQNLIVVGGPCANDVAAEVMGVAATVPECLAGFEAGKAMIKLYNTGAGNVAMLVAGATAEDTRRASRVVANYEDYDLSGDEVEVTGVGLTSIQVSKVS